MTAKPLKDAILILMPKLTPEILNAAIEGFEAQKRRIDNQIAELRQMLGSGPSRNQPEAASSKRKISAAARRRMALGQRKRWAAIKSTAESSSQAAQEPAKPKRKLSAAGKAAIVDALKKRWATKEVEAAQRKPVVAKRAAPKKAAVKRAVAKRAAKSPAQPASEQGGGPGH